MIHHPWAPAHVAQNENSNGAHTCWLFKTSDSYEPQRGESYERNQKTRYPCHGEAGQQRKTPTVIRRHDRAAIELTQQKPPIMFGASARKTLARCARRGAIGCYYHAASRFPTPHLTQPHIGIPILRTSRPMARRPDLRTPLLSKFALFCTTQPTQPYSFSSARSFDVHSDRIDTE